MGITGLLPLLKSIHKPVNLKKFAGQTIGVDAYGWLHRGTVACAIELAMDKPTRKFVDFAMHRVRMLQHFGVIPFLIFDGDYLPSKSATENDRNKRRDESKKLGMELLHAGKTSQAYLELQKAVDVTPEMARQLIDELKKTGVQYIVAPYEADAQLVYLERKGIIQGILSEDSDLLVFGAKCLLTKLDQYGNCIEINKADFCSCREVNLTGWSDVEFRCMAILSGCDYLASINKMGLKTAYRMVRKHKTIEKVIRMLSFDGKYHVPNGYLEAFQQAELTFLHQRVFCPLSNKLVYHTEPEIPIDDAKMPFIGAYVEPFIAVDVALGDLNPMTKRPIVVKEGFENVDRRDQPGLWAKSRPQGRRAATSDDLNKKGVSIQQFFKLKRTPLGELDPNCFQSSPSQQEALRRNSGPWPASPVIPRPYLDHPTTFNPSELSRSAPPAGRSQTGRLLPWTTSLSATRPQKRARLCDDSFAVRSSAGVESTVLGRSPFFSSPSIDPSPSVGRSKKNRSNHDDIYLYSDDSIEEAMLGLPDYDGWQKPKVKGKEFGVFDEVEEHSGYTLSAIETFESQSTTTNSPSQAIIPRLTPNSSTTSSTEMPPTPVPASFSGLKSKFAFTPIAAPHQNSISGLPSPALSLKHSRIPVPVKFVTAKTRVPKNIPTKPSILTPLQSLGAKALNRSNLATPPYTPTAPSTRGTSAAKRSALKTRTGAPFPEIEASRPSALKSSFNPADIPLPAISVAENAALAEFDSTDSKGSEDLIIHDSEEEGGALSPGDFKATGLDLSIFTFHA